MRHDAAKVWHGAKNVQQGAKNVQHSGLGFEHSSLEVVLNRPAKKVSFLLILPYKTWWKPHFPID